MVQSLAHLISFLLLALLLPICWAIPEDTSSQSRAEADKRSLCTAVVAALGCSVDLPPAGHVLISRPVREVCPDECHNVDSQTAQHQQRRRQLQFHSNPDGTTQTPLIYGDHTDARFVNLTLTPAEDECIFGEGAEVANIIGACLNAQEPLNIGLALAGTLALVLCSGFCSGLTLGLMGLDMTMCVDDLSRYVWLCLPAGLSV